ncbi:MAG: caspase family protein [Gammaproteobacteria bacterium]
MVRASFSSLKYHFIPVLTGGAITVLVLSACQSQTVQDLPAVAPVAAASADRLLPVDCLLPGQVRKLGKRLTYLSPRRPIKTTAVDCEIRGGEYVAFDRADYRTALNVWLEDAKAGDPQAQTYVGEIFEKGLGLTPDYDAARQWYLKAAKQNYSRAQINLGYLYEKGLGVPQDTVEALNWYRKASGLEADELEYASTLEVQANALAEQRTQPLREEIEQRKQEADALRAQLAATAAELEDRKLSLVDAEGRLAALNARVRELEYVPQGEVEIGEIQVVTRDPAEETELLRLKEQIAFEQAKVKQQQEEIVSLTTEMTQQKQSLGSQLEAAQRNEQALQQQVVARSQEATVAERELEQTKSMLAGREATLQASEQRVATLNAQLEQATQASVDHSEVASQIAALEQELGMERARVKQQREEMTWLESELARQHEDLTSTLSRQTQEIETLRAQVMESQQQLAQAQSQTVVLESRLAQERSEAERLRNSAAAENDAKVQRLEQQIAQREAELASTRTQVSRLQEQTDRYQADLASLEASAEPVVLAGPTIEILDPPIALTRANVPSVTLRSPVKARDIVGKVTAPAGLFSLTVNDRAETPDASGAFRASVPVAETDTPVNVAAVDQQGLSASVDFMLIPKLRLANTSETEAPDIAAPETALKAIEFGKYHALIIGNNEYPNLPDLDTAVNDAKEADELLRTLYGFETTLLLNADRYAILSALNDLRGTLTENDNLLIYYAGHGELDQVNLQGYWLPVDAEPDSTANWISNIAVTELLNAMSAKHVLVIADSCYSGAMTRSSIARLQAGMSDETFYKWMSVMAKTRSRTVLTSGGEQPVLDAGGGEHSVFARALFKVLRENSQVLEGYNIYRAIADEVQQVAAGFRIEQEPQYTPIRHAGHEAGEFLFVPIRLGS